jgi:PBP1b-binding outer membrane lipoprotein LpoB
MKKRKTIGSLLLIMFLLSGCWATKSIITTANITQPVLVGNVKTIKGEKMDNNSVQIGTKFSAAIVNSIYFWSTGYSYGHNTITQGSNVFDEQLLPLIDSSPADTSSILIVDQVRFKVSSGYWLFALYSFNKGWIDGVKHSDNPNVPKK